MSLGVTVVLSAVGLSVMTYTTDNQRWSARQRNDVTAFSLAEAGLNSAMAILDNSSNNALDPTLLPSSEAGAASATYEGGAAYWWGTLDNFTKTWTINAKGVMRNPIGGRDVIRYIRATTHIRASFMQPPNNPIWNYVVSLQTGSTCDMSLDNSENMQSPLYVMGNLCLNTPSQVSAGPLVVKGNVTLAVNTNIGTSSSPINEAHIVGGCSYKNGPWHNPCGPADMVFATSIDSVAPELTKPSVDLDAWYANAAPGPTFPCSAVSGTPPVFDNDGVRNNSVPTIFNLTPPSSDYSCVAKNSAGIILGQLTWNHTAKVLTVLGTIFIDGSAMVDYGFQNVPIQYNGTATLYLSGTMLIKDTKFCGGISADGSNCDFSTWNPNTEMLVIVAAGSGGQLPTGDSIQVVNSYFQGGLWGNFNIELDTTSQTEGPMIAGTEIIGQKVVTHSFPEIEDIPSGAPGVPVVYAQPDPPTNYSTG
jgi:hypothetical protein